MATKTISIITITARAEPRLDAMARALRASLGRCADRDLHLEWVIVASDPAGAFDPDALAGDRFTVQAVPGPPRSDGLPAHNSAKNAGLAAARGEYVVFLSDCMLVTQDWVSCAATRMRLGQGWRCKQLELADVDLDRLKQPFNHGAVSQPASAIRPIPASAVGGRCWGAPRHAFLRVQGFDPSFDGEVHGHDVECAIRMGRAGAVFVAPTGACAVRLRRTALPTNSKEARRGTRNQRIIAELTKDRDRTLPLRPSGLGGAATLQAPEASLTGAGAGDAPAGADGAAAPAPLAGDPAGPGATDPAGGEGGSGAAPELAEAPGAAGGARADEGGARSGGAAEGDLPEVPRDPGRGNHVGAPAAALSDLDLSDLDDLLTGRGSLG